MKQTDLYQKKLAAMLPDSHDIASLPTTATRDKKTVNSLRERWFNWRNATLADPGFHRWARRNPITRYVARRKARSLFDVCAGFVYSQTLSACVELKLFDLLKDGPLSRQEISKYCSLELHACDVLLRSAVSLKLLQAVDANRYGLGMQGAALLANQGVLKMIEHHAFFYRDLKNPVALLRGEQADTTLSLFWNYATHQNHSDQQNYTDLMSASQSMIAEQILDCYPIKSHQCMLDVGGSDGTFLRTVGGSAPDMKLMLFDLTPVAERAKAQFKLAGLPNKVECHPGDMFKDALPQGADLITLVRVVHDHNDTEVVELLKRCREALPEGGTLLIAEPMAVERVGDPATDAYFGFYLHAMGQGRPRTVSELTALLLQAGFAKPKEARTQLPMLVRILSAKAQ